MTFRALVSQLMVTMLHLVGMTTAWHAVCPAFVWGSASPTNSSGGTNLYWNSRFAPEGTSVQWSWGPHGKGRVEGVCLGKDLLDKLTDQWIKIQQRTMLLDLGSIGRFFPIPTGESHETELLLSHQIGNSTLRRWSHIGSTRYAAWQALKAAPRVVCVSTADRVSSKVKVSCWDCPADMCLKGCQTCRLWCGTWCRFFARNEQKKPFKYVVSCTLAILKKREKAVLSNFLNQWHEG